MLYNLFLFFSNYVSIFSVINSHVFRLMGSFLTAFGICLVSGFYFISLSSHILWSSSREFTPLNHKKKSTIASMGGIFILFSIIFSVMFWANLADPKVIVFMVNILLFGAIGLWDDWSKLAHKKGIKALYKFSAQLLAATIVSIALVRFAGVSSVVMLPFGSGSMLLVGPFFTLWALFILVACSNAVNLTDGLDGLAANSLLPNFILFAGIMASLCTLFVQNGEMAVVGASLVGAILGFLWYNSYPAQIFMGDVGSLSLGASLAYIALVSKYELLLVVSGGLFVMETISVIVQVFSYSYFKRRVFNMAPLHHHFELLGWPEPKITARFTVITWVLSACALMLVYFW